MIGFFLASAAVAQSESGAGDLLGELDLTVSQREEINEVLIGGMQSLNAVNKELLKLGKLSDSAASSYEVEQMRLALIDRRFHLAQSMASDILNVLDAEQLSKFDFGYLLEALPEDVMDNNTWEQEL